MSDRGEASTGMSRREAFLLFLAAVIWFLPGIWWGLPESTATTIVPRWGIDELGPQGAINAILAIFRQEAPQSPQYPLGHYLIQAIVVWPYYIGVRLADNVGFAEQAASPAVLVVLHRLPSVLMAAVTVVAAAAFIRRVTGSVTAARFAAGAVATIGPLGLYARTSNVDAGALCWAMLMLLLAAEAVRDGLTVRRAALLGLCAAAGVATKDQQYAIVLGVASVLLLAHLGRARQGSERWRAPVAGAAVAAGAYLLASGALLLPGWFVTHVAFIREGSALAVPPDVLRLVGTYYSNPATLAGYTQLGLDGAQQLLAAVGVPVLVLAAAGAILLARRDRWILGLVVIPSLALVAGVILPVRFVLPRFLLPIDLILCLLAAIALAEALGSARWRRGGQAVAVAALAWGLVRGADLTWQMHRDTRYQAAEWLDRNLQPGDTLAYYGATVKLPRLRRDVLVTPAPDQYLPDEIYGPAGPVTQTPQFILVIPQRVSEPVHEWNVPAAVFQGLMDGSRGYRQVLAIQTGALFPRQRLVAPGVNPPVRVFARLDMVGRLAGPPRIELPDPTVPEPPR